MKVTKREPKELKRPLDFSKIERGTVFKYEDETVALKIGNDEAVLLVYGGDESDWFELAAGYKDYNIAEILGKLVEIVVE